VSTAYNNNRRNHAVQNSDSKPNCCSICGNKLTTGTIYSTTNDSKALCTYCYTGIKEMMTAVGELHYEMARAYGIDPDNIEECSKKLPGIAVEEIKIRMQLNHLNHHHINDNE
jgi:hypothetical protein